MANSTNPLQDQIKALRDKYVAELPQKIRVIEEAWEMLDKNRWNAEDLTRVERLVHTLVGSGATFGVPEVSQRAREMETALKLLQIAGAKQSTDARARILPMLDSLMRAAIKGQ